MARALVTGGAGFIGSHLVDALVGRGDQVVVADDLSTGKESNLAAALEAGARLERVDVTDAAALAALAREAEADLFFHLAAQIDVRRSVEDPSLDAEVNVVGTVNALEGAIAAGARSFVLASSGGTVYGDGLGRESLLPFDEEAECLPASPYGQSKLAAEGFVGLYARERGLAAASLRLGNVFGPRQDPANEAGAVSIFLQRASAGEGPRVFGDGTQTRDYLYITDAVRGIIAAADQGASGVFNVGTGVETSVLELVGAVGAATGLDGFEPAFESAREGEVMRVAFDPAKAQAELGWKPQLTLEEGLATLLARGD